MALPPLESSRYGFHFPQRRLGEYDMYNLDSRPLITRWAGLPRGHTSQDSLCDVYNT